MMTYIFDDLNNKVLASTDNPIEVIGMIRVLRKDNPNGKYSYQSRNFSKKQHEAINTFLKSFIEAVQVAQPAES